MLKKIFLLVLLLLTIAAGFISYKLFRSAVSNKQNEYVYIQQGDDLKKVKEELINKKLITGDGFNLATTLLRLKTPKPGRYKFDEGSSIYNLVRKLRNGDQEMVKVTIVKERTKELLAGKFGAGKKFDFQFDSLQMIRYLMNNDSLKKFGADTNTIMSIIIPDTYSGKWNSTPDKVMQQFYSAYKKFWNEERMAKANKLALTPIQVNILASIVDEETTRKADKLNIASVYLNRLKKGMKLEADPTAKFVTRNFKLGRITGSHLKLESPYNTYLNKGLPPGPICTPSIESIEAVLNAPQTDYIFFVASYKFDGGTFFTSNYPDHQQYVKLFHAEQNRRADSIKRLKAAVK